MKKKAQGDDIDTTGLSEEVVYKIEIPANRYDLLGIEGLSSALRGVLGLAACYAG